MRGFRMRNLAILSLMVVLTGCAGPASMSLEQLNKLTDNEVCEDAHIWPTDMRVINQIKARNLTCHPSQEMCTAIKDKRSKDYQQCIYNAFGQIQQDEAQRQATGAAIGQAFSNYGATRYAPGTGTIPTYPTRTTHCTNTQFGMNCTSY